jgi:hypothetical protein
MDASQYKDYVPVGGRGGRFADMVALKGDKEIGDKMNKSSGNSPRRKPSFS